jgi:hypothetical protein
MNLEQIKAAGAFISQEPVKVAVSWKGNDFDVYVRQLSFGDIERMSSGDNSAVALIASAVLLGDDRAPLTEEDAKRLDVTLAAKLLEAVNTVNASKN